MKLTRLTKSLLYALPITVTICLISMLVPDIDYRLLFTLQMSIISWLPMMIVMVAIRIKNELNSLIIFSILLSLLGVTTGLLITASSLTIPAHYHGMTGAFNLAVIALFLQAQQQSFSKRLAYSYGSGLVLLILGLTWAGNLGVARKLAGEAQQLTSIFHQAAMLTIAVGALIAISSCVVLILVHLSKMRNNLNFENKFPLKST